MSTEIDLTGMDPAALRALASRAAAAAKGSDDARIAEVPSMNDEALRDLVTEIEDRDGACEDDGNGGSDYYGHHDEARCPACVGRKELRRRAYRRDALLPGANTAISIPGVQHASFFTGTAVDLNSGDITRHRPAPGSNRFVYVEALIVVETSYCVTVSWRTTNTSETPFETVYDLDERVDIYRIVPATPR